MGTKSTSDPRQEPRHSIAVISRRTGISQLVLRAWERRYEAVVPARTETGRRKYTDLDLEKLILLSRLTSGGHRIGDIATLSLDELKQLAKEFPIEVEAPASPMREASSVGELMEEAFDAIANLDGHGLESVLDRALIDLSKPDLRGKLLVPMLEEIGKKWQEGELRVAHEHMASSIVTTFLSSLNSRYQVAPGAPVVAVTTPAGQMHELGALLAAGHAYESGWDVLYLGPNMPAEELASAVRNRGAQAVLLSLVFPHGDAGTATELRELRRLLGSHIPLIVGGQAVQSYLDVLVEIEARIILTQDDLARALVL
jgi:methanogenic corrinoid protein MtbC1